MTKEYLTRIQAQSNRPNGRPDHRFFVIVQLDGGRVQRERISIFIIQKENDQLRIINQFESDHLQKRDEIVEDFAVAFLYLIWCEIEGDELIQKRMGKYVNFHPVIKKDGLHSFCSTFMFCIRIESVQII